MAYFTIVDTMSLPRVFDQAQADADHEYSARKHPLDAPCVLCDPNHLPYSACCIVSRVGSPVTDSALPSRRITHNAALAGHHQPPQAC